MGITLKSLYLLSKKKKVKLLLTNPSRDIYLNVTRACAEDYPGDTSLVGIANWGEDVLLIVNENTQVLRHWKLTFGM